MSRTRKLGLSVFFGFVILGHVREVAAGEEHWPFSNYPMYAGVTSVTVQRKVIVGVTPDDQEVPLHMNTHLSPFDNTRLYWALTRVKREHGKDAYQHALRSLLERYDWLRDRRRHKGPEIRGIRVYQTRWRLDADAATRQDPARKLLFEILREPAPSRVGAAP